MHRRSTFGTPRSKTELLFPQTLLAVRVIPHRPGPQPARNGLQVGREQPSHSWRLANQSPAPANREHFEGVDSVKDEYREPSRRCEPVARSRPRCDTPTGELQLLNTGRGGKLRRHCCATLSNTHGRCWTTAHQLSSLFHSYVVLCEAPTASSNFLTVIASGFAGDPPSRFQSLRSTRRLTDSSAATDISPEPVNS